MQLYFLSDDGGENFDLFVWAESRQGAIDRWVAYYAWHEEPLEARVWLIPTEVPEQPRALRWIDDVCEITKGRE